MKKKIRKVKKKRISEEIILKKKKIIFRKAFVKRNDMAEEYYFALLRDYLDGKALDEAEYLVAMIAADHFRKKINSIVSKIEGKNIYLRLASDQVREIGFKVHEFKKELSEITGNDIDTIATYFKNKFKKNEEADKDTIMFTLGLLSQVLSGISDRFYNLNKGIETGDDYLGESIIQKIN